MSSRSSKTTRAAGTGLPDSIRNNSQLVIVGRVRRPHGVRGEVVVEPMTDAEDRFAPGRRLHACVAGDGQVGDPVRDLTVESSRPHAGAMLVKFESIDDRDQAGELRHAWLVVDRSQVGPAPAGTHYHFDLIGCECYDEALGLLGEVVDVVEDGGGSLLAVRPLAESGSERQILIPFVQALLVIVDTDRGRIDMRLPDGLVEICTSGS